MSKWCEFCANDHGAHTGEYGDQTCGIILQSMMPDFPGQDFPWPEAWLPAPDDGQNPLCSRLDCLAFKPCDECGGDPGEEARADRVAEVRVYWRENAR
jgi:hypothetical protein